MRYLVIGMAAVAAAGAATVVMAQDAPVDSMLAVNGQPVACAPIVPRPPDKLAAQFDTRPRDLDDMSASAQRFFDPQNTAGAEFRRRQAEQRASDWPFLCRYRAANLALAKAAERPLVVFMGDSITEGWIEADPGFFRSNGFVDRGISGQSSSQMVARFYQDVVALHPRVVHIMTGTNDIGGATGPITADEFIGNVTAMVDVAQANRIRVVLASIPPMSRLLPRPDFNVRPVVRDLNDRLRRLARDRKLTFVDYYTPLAKADGAFDPAYANDGVHPTRAGYAMMAPIARRGIGLALRQAR